MAKKQFFIETELVFKEKPTNPKFQDLTGKNFGKLTVVGFAGINKKTTYWFCRCSCGNIVNIHASNLKRAQTESCGCLAVDSVIERSTKHGHAAKGNISPTYQSWNAMISRCQSEGNSDYERYGGRGINVSERWQKFENFLEDMGERPKGMTLDRKENDKGYCTENCRWATIKEQQNNRRCNHFLTFNGKTQTITQWAEEIYMKPITLSKRIQGGWPVEKALTKSVRQIIK